MLTNEEVEKLAHDIVHKLSDYFGNRVDDFNIEECTAEPRRRIRMIFPIYDYFSAQLAVAFGIGISLISGPRAFSLARDEKFETAAHLSHLDWLLPQFDREVRLRIPDKYLIAKGWAEPVESNPPPVPPRSVW